MNYEAVLFYKQQKAQPAASTSQEGAPQTPGDIGKSSPEGSPEPKQQKEKQESVSKFNIIDLSWAM